MSQGRIFMALQGIIEAAYIQSYGRTIVEDGAPPRRHQNVLLAQFLEQCAHKAASAEPEDEVRAASAFAMLVMEAGPFLTTLEQMMREQYSEATWEHPKLLEDLSVTTAQTIRLRGATRRLFVRYIAKDQKCPYTHALEVVSWRNDPEYHPFEDNPEDVLVTLALLNGDKLPGEFRGSELEVIEGMY